MAVVSMVLMSVVCLLLKVACDCSIYPDENTCNNQIGYRCLWNTSVTGSSSKCQQIFCDNYTDEATCTANNGVLGCKWDASMMQKCHTPRCGDFNDSEAACLGNGLACTYYESKCTTYSCSMFNDSEPTCTGNGKVGCKWNADGYSKCVDQVCGDFTASAAACTANNGGLNCKFTAGTAGAADTCTSVYGCSSYTVDGESSCLSNPYYECVWKNSACSTKSCLDIQGKSDCNKYSGCGWSYLFDSCWPLGCSDFDKSQTICESDHPVCNWKGSCKEGSGAKAISVSSLVMLLLLLLTFFAF